MTGISRRQLLEAAAAAPFAAPVTAGFFRWLPDGDDRALVIVELAGGNDGLNTVIPLDSEVYAKARPQLGGVRRSALPLADGYGLHESMRGIHGLVRDGLAGIVHSVGYPQPDRSHFRSRDIWHTADPGYERMTAETTGWLGRAADRLGAAGAAVPGLSVGSLSVPLILKGRRVVVPSLDRIEDYQVLVDPSGGRGAQRREAVLDIVERASAESARAATPGLESFVGEVAKTAVTGAEKLRAALAGYRPKAEYPRSALGRRMQLLARILVSGFGTRLFHVGYGGFDTHAQQLGAHAGLLRQFSDSVAALIADLRGHGALDRVTVFAFSEFGRRVAQNRSQGTDHGAGGPAFAFGAGVRPGLLGRPASLTELDRGDLIATTDFRELYAALLRRLGIDAPAILGGEHRGLELFA